MKLYFSKFIIFLGIFSLLMGAANTFAINTSYADNLEVIGNDIGLIVEPINSKLFDLTNLNPGDTKEAKIDISNEHTSGFEVFMRTERTSPQPQIGEADLFTQLILTVYLDGIIIYTGPMKDYASSNISLGNFDPNDKKELRAIVHLPGPETGNEFQGKTLEVKWYFIAEINKPEDPEDPETPEDPEDPEDPEEPRIPEEPEEPNIPEQPSESNEGTEPEIEETLEIDELIPMGIPEIPEEIEDLDDPVFQPEPIDGIKEIIESEIPRGGIVLPRTGESSSIIYYVLGAILLGLGLGMRKKNK